MPQENASDQQIRCSQYLPFEVVATSQNDTTQIENNTEFSSTKPINIKIRIRNKEVGKKHGTISIPKLSTNSGKKVRLVNSDQTIMSFDYYMEPNSSKNNRKKSHKNIFQLFRPGGCLRTQKDNDDIDEYSYSPGSFSDVNKIVPSVEENNISKTIILRKNIPPITPTDKTIKTTEKFMGKCKPGGCLDPPFAEDKYCYEPYKMSDESLHFKNAVGQVDLNKEASDPLRYEKVTNMNTKEASENINRIQLKSDVSLEKCSHSLITYPTGCLENNLQKNKHNRDLQFKPRISSEDKARISKNELCEIFFMPPKKAKTEKVEKKYSENVFKIVDETFFEGNKKEQLSMNHKEIEFRLSKNSAMSLNADADGKNCDVKTNKDTETSNDHFKTKFETTDFLDDVVTTAGKSDNISYVDKNTILDRNSEVALIESVLNIDENNMQVNEIGDLRLNFTHDKDSPKTENVNIEINEFILTPFKNKDAQHINARNTTYLVDNLATKTKEEVNSSVVSEKSLKMSFEDIAHKDKIKVTSFNCNEIPIKDLNIDSHVVIFTEPKETLSENFEVITDIDKTQGLPLKNVKKQNTNTIIGSNLGSIVSIEKEQSTEESYKSFILEYKDVPDLKKTILEPSITSEEIGNRENKNYPKNESGVIVFETKLIENLKKNESFTNTKERVIDIDEVRPPLLDSESKHKNISSIISKDVKGAKQSIGVENKEVTEEDKLKLQISNSLSSQKADKIDSSNELKDSECPIQKSKESFAKQIKEVFKTNEISTILQKGIHVNGTGGIGQNKNKFDSVLQDTESTYSLIKHQKPSKEKPIESGEIDKTIRSFVSNTETENLETSTDIDINTSLYTDISTESGHTLTKNEEKDHIEKSMKRDRVFLDSYQASFNIEKSIDNFNRDEGQYITHQTLDNGQIKSSNSNKSITNIISSTSLIKDKADEINHKSFNKLKTKSESRLEINAEVNKIDNKNSLTIHTELIQNKVIDLNKDIVPRISKENEQSEDNDQSVIETEKLSIKMDTMLKPEFYSSDNFNANYIYSEPSISIVDDNTDNCTVYPQENSNGVFFPHSSVEIDFGFRCSVGSDNKIVIHTIDVSKSLEKDVNDDVIIKTIIRMNDDEIRIPINYYTDLIMQIKQVDLTKKDAALKEQDKFENDFNKKPTDRSVDNGLLLQETLNSIYENLTPLNKIIQNLKEEANALSRQQTSIKEILRTMEIKPKRLINTYARCGCEKYQ